MVEFRKWGSGPRLRGDDRKGLGGLGRGPDFRRDDKCFVVALVLVVAVFAGCLREQKQKQEQKQEQVQGASELVVKYAKGFRLERSGEGTILIFSDPIKAGREIARYRLIHNRTDVKPISGCTDIVVPVTRMAASSTTHAGFLSALDAGSQLLGCNNPERLYDTVLFSRYLKGDLVRMGHDLEYNLEFLIASKPGLVLQTGIDGRFNPDTRLAAVDIPVMYILEWMEPTPLGRAEWIRVFGLITGREMVADSLFDVIAKNYLACAKIGRESQEKVKVLTGNVFKGTWYMPGGKNYMARFFEDAGMNYLYRDTDQSASLALSFESVVFNLADAPVWISVNVDSLSRLMAAEERYSVFRAVREQRVFSISNRINSHGGNDFWEGAVVRPDRVLADLLAIAHPDLVPGHIWNYYKPLIFDK